MTARPTKHPKTGVYQFRRAVPDDLRSLVGKREEKRSLATKDPEEAKRLHTQVSLEVEAKWASLRAGPRALTEREAHDLARPVFERWLATHRDDPGWQLLWHPDRYDGLWTARGYDPQEGYRECVPVDEIFFASMRRACFEEAGRIAEGRGLILDQWGHFTLARAAGAAFQRASLILEEEAKGNYGVRFADTSQLERPAQTSSSKATAAPFTFEMLLEEWKRERQPRPQVAYEAGNMLRKLESHLGYSDVRLLTVDHLMDWRDVQREENISAITIRNGRFAMLRAMLTVAVQNRKLQSNPAASVKITVKLDDDDPTRDYTDAEAAAVLTAASNARDPVRHWIPPLCAYSGARLGEICHLRGQDIRDVEGIPSISFTPDAGPLKNRRAKRIIPIHPVVLEAGFLSFVENRKGGLLFPELLLDRFGKRSLNGSKTIGRWVRKLGIVDERISPSHSWRHRFRTQSRKHGLAVDVVDAILGHARATVGDNYGEYPIAAMYQELIKLPDIINLVRLSNSTEPADDGPLSSAAPRS